MLKGSTTLFFYALAFSCSMAGATSIGKIAIIIDDIGNNQYQESFTALPKAVTFSILPFTPFSKKIAYSAYQQQREVLSHIPMQAHSHNHLLGDGALIQSMTKQEHQKALRKSLSAIPYAIGVNNHMGSELTENASSMQWTMEVLSQQGYFFVDSRTSAQSLAESSAIIAGLPGLRRDIFLDNNRTQQAMDKQFKKAIQRSKKSRYAIIIAHPYPETLLYLTQRLAEPSTDYQLVPLSELIPKKFRLALQRKKATYQQQKLVSAKSITTKPSIK